jgi:protein TonB
MITGYPSAVVADPPRRRSTSNRTAPHLATSSAVDYPSGRTPRWLVGLAVIISLSLHALVLLGIGPPRKKAAVVVEDIPMIRLAIPDVKDLEEPEPAPVDGNTTPVDLGTLVPMQADVPQLVRPSDFVQTLNFASLLEQPDFSKLKVYAVPEHIRTSGSKLAEQFGKIFNLSDLDRVPEPVLQPAPTFPVAMRREALSATVLVEFIVDTNGRVLDPVTVESSHHGFDDAAMAGVSRWKFRAGIKNGRKVNTRMRVPIVFKITDALD